MFNVGIPTNNCTILQSGNSLELFPVDGTVSPAGMAAGVGIVDLRN